MDTTWYQPLRDLSPVSTLIAASWEFGGVVLLFGGSWTRIVAGLGASLTTNVVTDLSSVSLTLLGICVLMAFVFVCSYFWEKRRSY